MLKRLGKKVLFPQTSFGDRAYSTQRYLRVHGYWPNTKSPKTFNEHLLKTKFNDLDTDLRKTVTDKHLVKNYIADRIGLKYVPRTFALLESRSAVFSYDYPSSCVVKPTHTSGDVFIKSDDCDVVPIREIACWLKRDYYYESRERNYKNLRPKIIVEERLTFDSSVSPDDFKIFCFFGKAKLIQHDTNRFGEHKRSFYTIKWEKLNFGQVYTRGDAITSPKSLSLMIYLAEILAQDFEQIRVDFYSNNDSVYVGELTNCHESACGVFDPVSTDRQLAALFVDPLYDPAAMISD